MKKLSFKYVLKILKKFKSAVLYSIAFYPVLITSLFFILAVTLLYLEHLPFVEKLKEEVPYLLIQKKDTARTILSSLFGGILSLTVFSFTMVMVVLNQASSNFSPRLLPGLISDKKHQIILGFYIGTLLYVVIVLMSLGTNESDKDITGFSVMIAAGFGALCTGFFVYFIHSISQAIQIHNIIQKLKSKGIKLFEKELKEQKEFMSSVKEGPSFEAWNIIKSDRTGFYRSFDINLLEDELRQKTNTFEIIPYADQHIWKGEPIIRVQQKLTPDEIASVKRAVYILENRHDDDSGLGIMIKLTEIAVKAMSPGINDPGTASNSISKLGELLCKALKVKPKTIRKKEKDDLTIIFNKIPAEELMRVVFSPIREYSKADSTVSYALMDALQYNIKNEDICESYKVALQKEMKKLVFDIKENIGNREDLNRILELVLK